MNNLVSRALIFRDWKYSKWFIPVIFIELFFMYVPGFLIPGELSSQLNSSGFYGDNGEKFIFYILLLSLTISLMSINLFHYDTNLSCCTLSGSMPFTRKEIILSKWLVGIYNLSICYFSIFVIMNSILICNFCWTNYFMNLLLWSTVNFLISICLFGLIVLIQSTSASSVFGGILASLFVAFPATVFGILYGVVNTHYGSLNIFVPDFLDSFIRSGLINKTVSFIKYIFNAGNDGIFPFDPFAQSTSDFILRCLFFLLISFAFFVLSLRLFRKDNFYGNIFAAYKFDLARKISMALVAYMLGFALNMFFLCIVGAGIGLRPDIVILFCIAIPILLYFVAGVAIKIHQKRSMTGGSL